jgi:hypothetical protein
VCPDVPPTGDDTSEMDEIEREFSIIAAEDDDELNVSQIPHHIGLQLAEPPLFTVCYSSQALESIREVAEVKVGDL